MLGILLIYFIGKRFYNLAQEWNKNKWLFAILGVVTYYAGMAIVLFLTGILMAFGILSSLENLPDMTLGIMAIPFGLLSCWGLYAILKRSWSRSAERSTSEMLDGDMIN